MYGRFGLKIVLLLSVLLVSSCASLQPTPIPPITDEEYDIAVAQAQSTLDTVRQALLSPKPTYAFIGLKIRIYNDATFEDIWTEPIDYYNGTFTTQMVEGATIERGFHPNSLVRIPVKDVLDWMILEDDGSLIGGYTIRLAYQHMTPEEQKEFLRVTGYKVESLLRKE